MAKQADTNVKKAKVLGLLPLTALVIGSMIGSGVFNLMQDISAGAALVAVLIGWAITGLGMLFLVLSFRNLNKKRPDLDAGIYSYAQAGFGKYMGFNSAWGYWISAWIGNVAYATILFSSLGYFFKVFGDGQNLAAVIGASVMLWLVHLLIIRGFRTAGIVNVFITAAKLIPIAIFILATFAAFKLNIFTADIWGNGLETTNLLEQVKSTMLITVWVFIGIEGAVVFSGRAKKRSNVPTATFLGFFTVLAIYVLMTVLSLGVQTNPQLAALGQPAMAGVLEAVVGPWGAVLVNIGLIVSVVGAWMAWTMFAAELPYQAAKKKTFPAIFAKENSQNVPWVSLTITNLLIQSFLLLFLLPQLQAYSFMYSLATSTILIPYAFTALYQLKYSLKEKAGTPGRGVNILIGLAALAYAVWLLYAAGFEYLLLTVLLYGPGLLVYVLMGLKKPTKILTKYEAVAAVVIIALFAYALWSLITPDQMLNTTMFA